MSSKFPSYTVTIPTTCQPSQPGQVKLLPSKFKERYDLNRQYMLSLKTENLLQNFYMEAGLWQPRELHTDIHGGWESPTCQVRGHFLGHWLSAAAMISTNTVDHEIGGKAAQIVAELARCQQENGGEWAGSIPEKFLHWIARGKSAWAPHYTLHKTMMGLFDVYAYTGNSQALDILLNWSHWFYRWTGQFTRQQMDDILDYETGGMLEIWVNLYGVTGEAEHRTLMERYYSGRLFDPLLEGKDPLTNMHANTTIPEVHGAARAYEVTGEERWRKIVEAYWRCGVTERGYYCTGGQTNGEVWSAPEKLYRRLGEKTQEHCTVYNMMRLARFLYQWTGDPQYADYWERNLYNGILAQQHPDSGMIAYWLPMRASSVKKWGTPTQDFWCCHGTLVQATPSLINNIFFMEGNDLILDQYIPCELRWERQGQPVTVSLVEDAQLSYPARPESAAYQVSVSCTVPQEFTLKIRIPWWVAGAPQITVNGTAVEAPAGAGSYLGIKRTWSNEQIHIIFPRRLTACPLPDEPDVAAFMDGPVVLAGVLDRGNAMDANVLLSEMPLVGDLNDPSTILMPDNEREWTYWTGDYRTHGQARNIRFVPLYTIRDERFQIYFPVKKS